MPDSTGLVTQPKVTGTLVPRVRRIAACTFGVVQGASRSTLSAMNFSLMLRALATSPWALAYSNTRLRPSTNPAAFSPSRKPLRVAFSAGWSTICE